MPIRGIDINECRLDIGAMTASTKTEQLQIRVTAGEKASLRALAARAGMDVSAFVLSRVLPDVQREFVALLSHLADAGRRRYALAELNDLLTDISAADLPRACATPVGLDALDEVTQNYVAAMVEEAAGHLGVEPPFWTAEIEPLRVPWFPEGTSLLRPWLLMASPVPFRRRNIFIESSLGTRASSGARVRERLPGWTGGTGRVRYAQRGLVRRRVRRVGEPSRRWGDVPFLDRDRLTHLLSELSEEMGRREATGELHLLGGAVMCLVFGAREATRDIDAAMRPASLLREAAAAVAAREGVADDWVNDAVFGFLTVRGDFEPWADLPNLRVLVATPEYMLAMKCIALRAQDEAPDRDDIRFLLRYLGLRSASEALDVVLRFYEEPMATLRTRLFLEEVFGVPS
jgi:hypothetical protein